MWRKGAAICAALQKTLHYSSCVFQSTGEYTGVAFVPESHIWISIGQKLSLLSPPKADGQQIRFNPERPVGGVCSVNR